MVYHLCLTSVVRTAERVHRAEGDVGGCGVHESGQCASWRAAVSLPGCGAGGQYCQNHLSGSLSEYYPWLQGSFPLEAELGWPLKSAPAASPDYCSSTPQEFCAVLYRSWSQTTKCFLALSLGSLLQLKTKNNPRLFAEKDLDWLWALGDF